MARKMIVRMSTTRNAGCPSSCIVDDKGCYEIGSEQRNKTKNQHSVVSCFSVFCARGIRSRLATLHRTKRQKPISRIPEQRPRTTSSIQRCRPLDTHAHILSTPNRSDVACFRLWRSPRSSLRTQVDLPIRSCPRVAAAPTHRPVPTKRSKGRYCMILRCDPSEPALSRQRKGVRRCNRPSFVGGSIRHDSVGAVLGPGVIRKTQRVPSRPFIRRSRVSCDRTVGGQARRCRSRCVRGCAPSPVTQARTDIRD